MNENCSIVVSVFTCGYNCLTNCVVCFRKGNLECLAAKLLDRDISLLQGFTDIYLSLFAALVSTALFGLSS